jgi:hypothetical protein
MAFPIFLDRYRLLFVEVEANHAEMARRQDNPMAALVFQDLQNAEHAPSSR